MNRNRLRRYLRWARWLILCTGIAGVGLALSTTLGVAWLSERLFVAALTPLVLLLALALAILVEESVDLPNRFL